MISSGTAPPRRNRPPPEEYNENNWNEILYPDDDQPGTGTPGLSVAYGDDLIEWPTFDPSIISKLPPPDFPVDVFKEWAPYFVELAGQANSPVDYIGMGQLAACASLIGCKRFARVYPGWQEPAVLWVAFMAGPSKNKSPALGKISKPLAAMEQSYFPAHDLKKREHQTALEVAKIKYKNWQGDVETALGVPLGGVAPTMPADAVEPDPPQRRRHVIGDATPEAVAKIAQANPGGFLCTRDELAGWYASFDRYQNSSGRAFWIEAFGGGFYQIDRAGKDDPLHISNLGVSIVGGIQPDRLREVTSGADDGLTSRFIIVYPYHEPFKEHFSTLDLAPLMAALKRLASVRMDTDEEGNQIPRILPMTVEGKNVTVRFAQNAEKYEANGRLLESHIGKLRGFVVRTALTLTFMDWAMDPEAPEPLEISLSAVSRAVALAEEYLYPMAKRVYQFLENSSGTPGATTLANYLIKNRKKSFNSSTLRLTAQLPGLAKAKDMNDAVDDLVEAGWIYHVGERKGGTNGRVRKDYIVRSEVFALKPDSDMRPES